MFLEYIDHHILLSAKLCHFIVHKAQNEDQVLAGPPSSEHHYQDWKVDVCM